MTNEQLQILVRYADASEAESLLRRALHACNVAERFEFDELSGDDSYRLAADIERYLKKDDSPPPYSRDWVIKVVEKAFPEKPVFKEEFTGSYVEANNRLGEVWNDQFASNADHRATLTIKGDRKPISIIDPRD